MGNFRDLKVWEKSHALVLDVYKATAIFPKEEVYGLTAQIRRAAVSVPSNIAEGSGRGTDRDMVRFLYMSLGSANELEYQLRLGYELEYLASDTYDGLKDRTQEVQRMLASLIERLEGALTKAVHEDLPTYDS